MTGRPCVISNVKRGMSSTLMKPADIILNVIAGRVMRSRIGHVLCLEH